jgi:hypothetical protein
LGWRDEQRPDGTIVLMAPTGHIYITEPFGAALFPALGKSTGELPVPPVIDLPDTDRTAMMPRRRKPANKISRTVSTKSAANASNS